MDTSCSACSRAIGAGLQTYPPFAFSGDIQRYFRATFGSDICDDEAVFGSSLGMSSSVELAGIETTLPHWRYPCVSLVCTILCGCV